VEKVINIYTRLYMKDIQNYYTTQTMQISHTQYHGLSLKIKKFIKTTKGIFI